MPICPGAKKNSAGNSNQLPTQNPSAHAATSGRSPELPDISPEVDSPRSQNPGAQNPVPAGQLLPLSSPAPASVLWSWRRDLNPRPSDYKSDALPAELRQLFNHPEAFPEPDSCADTLQLSAYTAQKSRLAHRRSRSKREKTRNRAPAKGMFPSCWHSCQCSCQPGKQNAEILSPSLADHRMEIAGACAPRHTNVTCANPRFGRSFWCHSGTVFLVSILEKFVC